MKNYYLRLENIFGEMMAEINESGEILGLWFDKQKYYPKIEDDQQEIPEEVKETMNALSLQLEEYIVGKRSRFTLKLAPKGTKFRESVWKILLEISYGQTITYGEIAEKMAKQMGKARMSAQAVGGAVGHNPIAILIPCHRVIGKDGSLTGYAGGLDRKEILLKLENNMNRFEI